MADALHRAGPPTVAHWPADDAPAALRYDSPASPPSRLQYLAYLPANYDTPPSSPPPRDPHLHGPAAKRQLLPMQLNMDTAVSPAYERRAYSPAPESPTVPFAALPSPKFPAPRQRAPSLLRHAAVSSPKYGPPPHDGPTSSPVVAPAMRRDGAGPASPDLRAIFNPLASNPPMSSGPQWDSSCEDVSGPISPIRPRGYTSSSQASFTPAPPLRSVTSIPDYGQYRTGERSNLSGTYKPNRGVPNWSHSDYYPPPPMRQLRGEEPRFSLRSGYTNASSSVMEPGTGRSSIATARSSVASDRQNSIYSRDQSRDRLRDRDDSPETAQTSDLAEEDEEELDAFSAVDDVIDAYCYDEDVRGYSMVDDNPSPAALDMEPPELSQTPSRDMDSLSSFHSSENLTHWNNSPIPPLNGMMPKAGLRKHRLSIRPPSADTSDQSLLDEDTQGGAEGDLKPHHTAPLYTPRTIEAVTALTNKKRSDERQRLSREVPRRISMTLQALSLNAPNALVKTPDDGISSKIPSAERAQMSEMHREIAALPQLPMNKARMSRRDWADIEAYSRRHSQRPSASRLASTEVVPKMDPTPQSPQFQKSQSLPEVDEDEAIPRRASTSVYDRKSGFGLDSFLKPVKTAEAKPTAAFTQDEDDPRIAPAVRKMVAAKAERDRYGFKKESLNVTVQEHNAWASRYEEHIIRRRNKWIALMVKQGLSVTEPTRFPEMSERVKRYARKGYPPEWRGAMWWYYSGGQHALQQKENIGLYASLAARIKRDELNKDDKDAIERDLDRTFPDNIHFRPEPATDLLDGESDEEPALIQDLREVLSCFALNNPSIGYCQSLNFIAGLLLLFLKQDKEKCFIILSIITQNHLPGAHARSLANTEVNVLMMLIKDYLPKVWASINDTDLINSGAGSNAHPNSKFQRQPTVALSCTSWFMSLFVGVLPIETVLRIWDAFLYEGPRALYRYALAIFKLGEPEIKKYRPGDGELFMLVQNLPRTCIDPNILHDFAFVKKGFGSLSQAVIDQKRLFWREQNKTIAHQNSVKSARQNQQGHASPTQRFDGDETDGESVRRAMGGLRRKASRRFRRM
ncbi:rab-GTPase-TBC domain-containing protein, partial [Boeremia exigua]|uniref:rab-GTPase-TBC domain-containing protein n=1 Tax=Boeremia exigua TaxID=749465 RepID=UPI001E8CD0B3